MNAVFSKATGFGCSTFLFARDGEILFGKNTDTPFEGEYKRLLLVNKRDCRKEPLKHPGIPSRAWTSKYGSVTLTLFGKEFPEGGMNEAGLVLMPMTLTETEYPPVGKTPRLELGQWKQYGLDSFGSVGEVVDALDGMAPLGYTSVFDIVERRIYFRTLGCRSIRSISFDGLDFSLDSPVLMLDVNAEGEGDISTRFVPLTAEANQAVAADVRRVALEAVSGSIEMPLLGMTFAEMVEQISDFSCASVAGC